jgi:amidase
VCGYPWTLAQLPPSYLGYHIEMDWQSRVADKQHRLNEAIPQEWRIGTTPDDVSVMDYPRKSGLLTTQDLEITESSAADIVAKIASGQLSSTAVTTAFCKRAALAQQLVRPALNMAI